MSMGTAWVVLRRGFGATIGLVVLTGVVGWAGCDSKKKVVQPEAPVVTAPAAAEAVRSPVTVEGTGEAGSSVTVTVFEGSNEIGNGGGVVDAQGAFSVEVTFTDQTVGTPLQIEVTLANSAGSSLPVTVDVVQAGQGNTYATAVEAPTYPGAEYSDMQIYDVANDVFMDNVALLEALDGDEVVFFGEQHETPPIHELQLWMLDQLTSRHDDVSLGMEHFQTDEQDVIDDYLDGTITSAQFLADSEPWPDFEDHWKPLVDHMKVLDRPVVATNIPAEALNNIYGNGLTSPLDYVNSWGASSPYDDFIPPRPMPGWDGLYQDYFETGFDYASHGQNWGLTYQEALDYFSDLAILRDHNMGYFIASHVEDTGSRVFFVGGDWHVQTGIATPSMAAAWSSHVNNYSLITTTPRSGFEALRVADFQGHAYGDYILLYD